MNICGHLIKTSTIIGIGILYRFTHTDMGIKKAYNPIALGFVVYTTYSTIEIKSDYFILGVSSNGLTDSEKRNRERYIKFEEQYYEAAFNVAELIGEMAPEKNKTDFDEPGTGL